MRITNLWPFLLLLLGSGSCKPRNDGSDVESLANFAGGREVNQCKGSFETRLPQGSVVAPPEFAATVNQALTAVPTGVQRVLFETFKGRLIVSSDAGARCRGVKNAEVSRARQQRSPQVISCWRPEGGVPVIRVNAKRADILHATVRAFGYFVSEEWLKGNDAYCQKAAVGKALLEDVGNSNGRFRLDAFTSRLDSTVLAENMTPEERSEALDDLPPPVHSAARDLFYDYAFAEAFDSYFCSSRTRAQMTAKKGVFRRTGEAFAGIAEVLEELSPEAVASSDGDEVAQIANDGSAHCGAGAGLALFGRYRSGSVVQNIRNRRNNGWRWQQPVYYGNGQQQQVQGQGQVEWSNQYGASTVTRMNFAQELRGYADGYYKKVEGTESTYVWITNSGRRTAYKVQYASGKWIVLPGSTTAEPAVATAPATGTATATKTTTSTKTATSTSTSTATAATSPATSTATSTSTSTGTGTSTNTPSGTTTTISPIAVNNTNPTPTNTVTATSTGTTTTATPTGTTTATATVTTTSTTTATATTTSSATGTGTGTSTTVDSLEQAKKDAAKLKELLGGLQDEPSADALGESTN